MIGRGSAVNEEGSMDATLEAMKRDGRGQERGASPARVGPDPRRGLRGAKEGQAPEGVPVAVDPKEVLRILHSDPAPTR